MVRVVGTSPDTLLVDHLYQSIRHELGLVKNDPTTTADGHWTERIGCQLPNDTRLTILLAGIDRLDSWGLMTLDKLPENVRLIVNCFSLPKDVRGWTVQQLADSLPLPTPASWSSDSSLNSSSSNADAILADFFDETERRFPVELVRKTCAMLNLVSGAAGRNSSGLTEAELRLCLSSQQQQNELHQSQLLLHLGNK